MKRRFRLPKEEQNVLNNLEVEIFKTAGDIRGFCCVSKATSPQREDYLTLSKQLATTIESQVVNNRKLEVKQSKSDLEKILKLALEIKNNTRKGIDPACPKNFLEILGGLTSVDY